MLGTPPSLSFARLGAGRGTIQVDISRLRPARLSGLPPTALVSAIEVESSTDERKVAEGLGRVAELLAAAGDLLGEHGQVVGEGQHVLEEVDGPRQVLGVVRAGPRHSLDQPERAHRDYPVRTRR